ncbi:GTP 3',8-cyclase MoaA [Candidatus Bathyarchaeota archaeon CG07_land_8_20_14_0_80_47_9]|nr:MAG: GTP 3',8-cyclase MoaA [Candidatus Bathyarchaeota archaeon CG07_land_8_20_14_0_80_47_9]
MVLKDSCGRPLLNLRIAITKKCNLRCSYCHGEGEVKRSESSETEMTGEEIVRIAKVAVGLGISRLKLTGGEPLTRSDVVELIKKISLIPHLSDLSMTTNGTLLAPLAKDLHTNGLRRVNINLPTLNGDVYHKLTEGNVNNALEGVKAAVEAGFCPVKVNMLVLKGVNDCAVPEMIEFARETGTILQLIELEPINVSAAYYSANHKPLDEYETLLKQEAVEVETRQYMQNRRIYRLPDVKVETICPTENTDFCLHCTRLRVTSDGKLKPCLMRNDNLIDILTPLRNGASDEQLMELFELANQKRQPYNKN